MTKENVNFDKNLVAGDRVLFKVASAPAAMFGEVVSRFTWPKDVVEYYLRPDDQNGAKTLEESWEESDDEGEVVLLAVASSQEGEMIVGSSFRPVISLPPEPAPAAPPATSAMPPNPKKLYGAQKPDLSLIPPVGDLHMAMAFENGAGKYGAYNWRKDPVEAMTYIAAMKRHIDLFLDGQDYSSDANVHNLGHAMACCAILLDSQELGILIDNRPRPGASEAVQNRLKAQKAAALADKVSK